MGEFEIAIIIGCLGAVFGAVVGALISGIVQIYVTLKNLQNSQKEYEAKIQQIREDQRRVALGEAKKLFCAENTRFYDNMRQEIELYDRLLNELHYLNNMTHPNGKDKRILAGAYPHIDNNICEIVGNTELPGDIAKLLGALRSNISYYNSALEKNVSCDILEDALFRIYRLIDPINEEQFVNYCDTQTALRNYERKLGNDNLNDEVMG